MQRSLQLKTEKTRKNQVQGAAVRKKNVFLYVPLPNHILRHTTMRETQFIRHNQAKWAKFEKVIAQDRSDPELLSNLFLEVTDDLSYSRTFYPNRSVRVYLNGIAQKVFYGIYKNRRGRLGSIWKFWSQDVPQIIYEARRELLFSLAVFLFAVLIGVFSTVMDVDFPRVILGDRYVEMTEANIDRGEPMSVYSDGEGTDMFLRIALNNLRVAALTFIVGLLFGTGTVYLLLYNGIMVGAFQMLFFQRGVYWESIFGIWVHGAIEISCIIIAGGAGLALGRGALFPGTYTRLQSLQLAARRGILIMLTIAPLIVLAAFIEGFITGSSAGYGVRAAVVIGSFTAVFLYFVVLPYFRANREQVSYLRDVDLPAVREAPIVLHEIKSVSKVFSDTFGIIKNHIQQMAFVSAVVAAVYTTVVMLAGYPIKLLQSSIVFDALDKSIANLGQFILPDSAFDVLWWCNVGGFAVLGAWSVHKVMRLVTIHNGQKVAQEGAKKMTFFAALQLLAVPAIGAFVLHGVLQWHGFLLFLMLLSGIPLLLLWQSATVADRINPFSGLGQAFSLGFGNYGALLGTFWTTLLMLLILLFLGTAPIASLFSSVVTTFIPMSATLVQAAQQAFFVFINAFILFFALPIIYVGVSVAYFSFRETRQANDLYARIEKVGVKRRSYGMERE